jgi:hypothetical protein
LRGGEVTTIKVVHLVRTPGQMHIFANFAEDVWREFRKERRIEVDLDAVDHGSATLLITMRPALKRRVLPKVDLLIQRNMLEGKVRVEGD